MYIGFRGKAMGRSPAPVKVFLTIQERVNSNKEHCLCKTTTRLKCCKAGSKAVQMSRQPFYSENEQFTPRNNFD